MGQFNCTYWYGVVIECLIPKLRSPTPNFQIHAFPYTNHSSSHVNYELGNPSGFGGPRVTTRHNHLDVFHFEPSGYGD